MDSSSTGTRPANFVFLSGEAQPLHVDAADRRFFSVNLPPTDAPVLRNDLWDAYRNIQRGLWTVAIYSSHHAPRLLGTQDYVVDDHGNLAPLDHDQVLASNAWYASTYTIDAAACDWMDQFALPAPGSALHAMAGTARASRQPAHQPAAPLVQAHKLPQPRNPWYSDSVLVDDDADWQPGQGLLSVEIEHDEQQRLVLTHRQARALAAVLMSIITPAEARR